MFISGIEFFNMFAESENRAVEKTSSTSKESSYYQDQNPDRTRNNDFARALSKAQSDIQNRDRKLRRFKMSEDYEELQKMQPEETPSWVETVMHVSEWETSKRARPQDLLAKIGW